MSSHSELAVRVWVCYGLFFWGGMGGGGSGFQQCQHHLSMFSVLSLRLFLSWRQLSRGLCESVVASTAGVAPGRLVVAVTQKLLVVVTAWKMPSVWR